MNAYGSIVNVVVDLKVADFKQLIVIVVVFTVVVPVVSAVIVVVVISVVVVVVVTSVVAVVSLVVPIVVTVVVVLVSTSASVVALISSSVVLVILVAVSVVVVIAITVIVVPFVFSWSVVVPQFFRLRLIIVPWGVVVVSVLVIISWALSRSWAGFRYTFPCIFAVILRRGWARYAFLSFLSSRCSTRWFGFGDWSWSALLLLCWLIAWRSDRARVASLPLVVGLYGRFGSRWRFWRAFRFLFLCVSRRSHRRIWPWWRLPLFCSFSRLVSVFLRGIWTRWTSLWRVFLVVLDISLGTVGSRGRSLLLIVDSWLFHRTSRARNWPWLLIIVGIAVIIALIEVITGSVLVPVALEIIAIIVVEVVLSAIVVIVRLFPNEGLLGRGDWSRVWLGFAWLSCGLLHFHSLVIFTYHWLSWRWLDIWLADRALPFQSNRSVSFLASDAGQAFLSVTCRARHFDFWVLSLVNEANCAIISVLDGLFLALLLVSLRFVCRDIHHDASALLYFVFAQALKTVA